MSNLSADWGSGYSRCDLCKQLFHASGAVHCACMSCEVCGDGFPPHEMTGPEGAAVCEACGERECDDTDCSEGDPTEEDRRNHRML